MTINCRNPRCNAPVERLALVQANVTQTPEFGDWIVDLVLACPACGQQYVTALANAELQPITSEANDD
ncbi:hypothetical protein [Serratia marcescens]|uniref:hypothetical protein n=1 Tax=Serratia marcescens TaxID=615 RepID=UPI0034E27FE7